MTPPWRDIRVATTDGISLFVRDYDQAGRARLPVVCLPGLTRNHRDFTALAERLAPRRRVVCPDMRGRGGSDRDSDPVNYNPLVETHDVLRVLEALEVARAVFVGSSRGGLQIMLLAVIQPAVLAAAVLVDVGPKLEMAGLMRIMASLGAADHAFADWDSAAAALKRVNLSQMPDLPAARWADLARATMVETAEGVQADYDPQIAHGARLATDEGPPELWPQFRALSGVPLLTIRGGRSDILSAETLAEMHRQIPAMRSLTLPDRGHVPFLDEPEAVAAIDALLDEADARCTPT